MELGTATNDPSVLDENHLIAAVRYIERNPVRAGIVRYAWEYSWSSAAYHAGKTDQDRIVESDDMLKSSQVSFNPGVATTSKHRPLFCETIYCLADLPNDQAAFFSSTSYPRSRNRLI